MRVLRVEGEGGDIGLVPFEFVLCWFFEHVEFLGVNRPILFFVRHGSDILLQTLILLLQGGYLLLESKYRFPFDFEPVALRVDIGKINRDLLREGLSCVLVLLLN